MKNSHPRSVKALLLLALILILFFMPLTAPLAAQEPLLRSASRGQVTLHFAHEIPSSETRLFLDEYTRALAFLEREYPIPYPFHGKIEQYVVTSWRDYTVTTYRHKGLLHMYIGPPTLYLIDFFEAMLLPVAPNYLCPGLAQFLYSRYRGEDPHLAAALFRPAGRLSLKAVLDPLCTYGPERTGIFVASFIAYLVDRYGWEQSIRFIQNAPAFSDFSQYALRDLRIEASELEAGWLSTLERVDLAAAGVEPQRVHDAFRHFNRLVERWQAIRFPYNQAELVTEYTRCRLLLPSLAELRPLENALERFEKAIRRAQWIPLVPIIVVLAVFGIHFTAWYCRMRRAVKRIREKRLSAKVG